jgi:DNA mismatch endonuclease (patch repair protein)
LKSKKQQYYRDGRSPIPLKESTSRVMRANKGKDTKPEMTLRRTLWKLNVRGYRLHSKGIPGRPDIVFKGRKIAVFINGCFWHRCPYCNPNFPKTNIDFWSEKFSKNIERDRRKIYELKKNGWNVLIVWECEINDNVSQVSEKIKKIIDKIK